MDTYTSILNHRVAPGPGGTVVRRFCTRKHSIHWLYCHSSQNISTGKLPRSGTGQTVSVDFRRRVLGHAGSTADQRSRCGYASLGGRRATSNAQNLWEQESSGVLVSSRRKNSGVCISRHSQAVATKVKLARILTPYPKKKHCKHLDTIFILKSSSFTIRAKQSYTTADHDEPSCPHSSVSEPYPRHRLSTPLRPRRRHGLNQANEVVAGPSRPDRPDPFLSRRLGIVQTHSQTREKGTAAETGSSLAITDHRGGVIGGVSTSDMGHEKGTQ